MSRYAYVADGVVKRIIVVADSVNLNQLYSAGYVLHLHLCDDTVQVGWTYDGTTFAAPSEELEKADLLHLTKIFASSTLATALTIDDVQISARPSDTESLTATVEYAKTVSEDTVCRVKLGSTWAAITAAKVLATYDKIIQFRQQVIEITAVAEIGIADGTYKTRAQLESLGWPSSVIVVTGSSS